MPRKSAALFLLVTAGMAWLLTPAVSLAAGKLDAIKARGKLLVGVTESSPPFSFRDDGKGIVGYDVDLAGAVAKRLGVGTEKVTIINADRIPALQQDRVDLVAVGMTRSKKRAKDVDFSYAYLDSPHMILVRKDIPVRKDGGVAHITDLAGRKLALVRSASVDAKLKAAVPSLQIVYFDTYDAAFAALAEQQRRCVSRRQDARAVVRAEKRSRGGFHADRRLSAAAHRGVCLEEKHAALPRLRQSDAARSGNLRRSSKNLRHMVRAAAAHIPHSARLTGV